jgi:hypothetical protein
MIIKRRYEAAATDFDEPFDPVLTAEGLSRVVGCPTTKAHRPLRPSNGPTYTLTLRKFLIVGWAVPTKYR